MIQNRTLEDYKRAGAWMRLLKSVLTRTHIECSKVLRAHDADRFNTVETKVGILCSRAEDNMFNDFPKVSNDYLDAFYGVLDSTPFRNDVDKEQVELAEELIKELFGENWK